MSAHDLEAARAALQVRWDPPRERHVLARTLERCERRARARRAATWMVAAAIALLLLRVLPRLGGTLDDSGGFAGARPASSGTGGNAGTG
jgi:hypothetical protein